MMCKIPDDYIHIDDVIARLEALKDEIVSDIDETIYKFTGEDKGQEPLRELAPITEELKNRVQEKLDNLKG